MHNCQLERIQGRSKLRGLKLTSLIVSLGPVLPSARYFPPIHPSFELSPMQDLKNRQIEFHRSESLPLFHHVFFHQEL